MQTVPVKFNETLKNILEGGVVRARWAILQNDPHIRKRDRATWVSHS